jgi:hypothetical protein
MMRGYKSIFNDNKKSENWHELGYSCESDYILVNTSGLGNITNCPGRIDVGFWDKVNYKSFENKLSTKNKTYCFGCGAVINRSKYKCDYCGSAY